jgi:hypothetical protein
MVLDDDVVQRIQFHTRKWKISPDFSKKAEAVPQTRHVDITQSGDRRTKHASAPYAGEGAQREFLEQESKHLNVADRVRFLGFANQSQLPAIYTPADLPCCPPNTNPSAWS